MSSAILMLVAVVAGGALFVKCTVLSSNQVRSMRWRTKLRMRPGPGFASHWEITFRFSRLAALYHGGRCRPDMPLWARLVSPARLYAVRLGRAGVRRAYARGEDQVGIVAPQRTNKSGILADRVYGHPGAAVVVSTRDDLFRLTSGHRAGQGPVLVFNPEGVGGVPSTFRPDIVADCADPEIAIRTASALAGPAEGDGDMRFWLEKSVFAIAALLHAAALLGEDMSAVWRWSQRLGDPMQDAMAHPGASRELLAAALEIYKDTKSADSIRMTMGRSLAWVGVPALRDSVSGPGVEPFDAASWMSSGGTLYVISSGEVATSTALFRAVVEKLHRDCVYAGTFTACHRIPNPVLFALDEVTQTAQVPLDQWLATSAGSGIQVCYVVHTPAQLRARYGTALADAIWALTGTKIVLGGNSDEQMDTEISRLCGQVPAGESMRPVVPAAYIRQLPESRALVIAMNRSPLAVKVRPVWRRITFRLGLNPAPFVTPVRPVLSGIAIAGLPEPPEERAA